MWQDHVFIDHDTVDDQDLLGHLTHVGDAWIFLRFLNDGLLHHTPFLLLRAHREGQKEGYCEYGNLPDGHISGFFYQFVIGIQGVPHAVSRLWVHTFDIFIKTFDVRAM